MKQTIFSIIIIILKTLIAIGDAVLWVYGKIIGLTRYTLLLFRKLLLFLRDTLAAIVHKIVSTLLWGALFLFSLVKRAFSILLFLRKLRFVFPRPSLSFPIPQRRKLKQSRVTSPVGTKLKYFILGTIFSFLFIFTPLLVLVFLQDLPSPRILVLGQIPQTTKIYDRNGTLLYQMYADQNRTVVPLSDVPVYLQQATVAIEDKSYWEHPGFDLSAIIRSAVKNLSGEGLQGGSTITQQLVKSALLSPETSITRKIKEVILAFWTERIYTKKEILAMYFNFVPYGGTKWGVSAAAEGYFGKKTKDLNLAESAFLAGIPRAPTIYSPFGTTPTLWKRRQIEVLDRMVNLGYITKAVAQEAMEEELVFEPPQPPLHAPHFVMYVRDWLVKKYGVAYVERGGLTVTTTLDLPLQEKVQKIVRDEVERNAALNLTNGAAMVTVPKNGDILAMIGSRDYFDTQRDGNVNVTTSLRQPGSSIKVVTYAAALGRGFTAATILDDSPVTYTSQGGPSYTPVNYDGKFHGRIPLRLALGNSFNIPAVKTLSHIGVPTFIDLGRKMGITTWGQPARYGLSITLGSADVTMADMTTLYGTLANGGVRIDVNPIIKITDSKGNILEAKDAGMLEGKRIVDEGIAFILSSILSDNQARAMEFGTNSPLNLPKKTVSVKTGTSDNKRDNWTIGYTPSYLAAVWVGNNNGTPMSQTLASGITGAAPIWHEIMELLLTNRVDEKPKMPVNVIQKSCLGRMEYFVKGSENSVNCAFTPTPSQSPTPKP